jgi:hypothetical protein
MSISDAGPPAPEGVVLLDFDHRQLTPFDVEGARRRVNSFSLATAPYERQPFVLVDLGKMWRSPHGGPVELRLPSCRTHRSRTEIA